MLIMAWPCRRLTDFVRFGGRNNVDPGVQEIGRGKVGGSPTSPSFAGGTRFRMIQFTALTPHVAFMTSKLPLWFARHAWHQPIPP